MKNLMDDLDPMEVVHSKTRQAYNLAAQKYHDLFHDEMNEKEYDRRLLDRFAARFTEISLVCDAGCGPSGHIGRYLSDKGISVVGVDISDQCIELARQNNPGMRFERGDIARLPFESDSMDGVLSYYSIIHTPKAYVSALLGEFFRVLKCGGYLLVAVKVGTREGYVNELVGIKTEIYLTLFTEEEIARYFEQAGFLLEWIEKRNPYDFEISNERIFAMGKKP